MAFANVTSGPGCWRLVAPEGKARAPLEINVQGSPSPRLASLLRIELLVPYNSYDAGSRCSASLAVDNTNDCTTDDADDESRVRAGKVQVL